jgi:DoxX-like family
MSTTSFGNVARPGAAFGKSARYQARIGLALTVLAVLFLLMDAVMKLLALPNVLTTTAMLGYPVTPDFARFLGGVLLICTVLYAWPRTAALGAILLTAYLGGAIASHVRIGSPLFSHILFGVYVALFVWGGLFLRDHRVRAIFSA